MLLQILGAGVVLGAVWLILWMGFRSARQEGAATEQAREAEHVVQNAERITAARDAAPADADALVDRVRGGGKL